MCSCFALDSKQSRAWYEEESRCNTAAAVDDGDVEVESPRAAVEKAGFGTCARLPGQHGDRLWLSARSCKENRRRRGAADTVG